MADLRINVEEGIIPNWMVDSNLQAILAQLKSMDGLSTKQTDELTKVMKDHIKNTNSNANNANKQTQERLKQIKEEMGVRRRVSTTVENFFDTVGSTIGLIFSKTLTALTSTVAVFSGVLIARANDLADSLNELTKQGVARGDALGESVDHQILKLNALGLSTESAIGTIMDNSRVFAVASSSANEVIKQFDDLTASGIELGMTFGDATAAAADELSQRQALFNIANVQASTLSNQVADTIRNQVKYSQALGVSIDELASFSDSLTTNNGLLAASLVRFNDAVRSEATNGVRNFAIAMRGLGGEGGGEIAAAVTEAMIGGAIGFSDTAVDMIAVMPRLSGAFNSVIQDFRDGQIDGAGAAEMFTQQLSSLTEQERQRIFVLARAGDQTARMMAQTVIAFEQSAQRMSEQGFNSAEQQSIQKGANLLQTAFSQIRGTIDFVINSFVFLIGGIDEFGAMIDTSVEAFVDFRNNLRDLLYASMGLKRGQEAVTVQAGSLADMFKGMPDKIRKFMDSFNARLAALVQNIEDAGGLGAYLKSIGKTFTEVVGDKAKEIFSYLFDEETGKISSWWSTSGKPMMESAWAKIKEAFEWMYNKIVGWFGGNELDVTEVTEGTETKTEVTEGSTESAAEKPASKPFLTRMSEKIFQGLINVLGTSEAQQTFANLGQSMVGGAIAVIDSYLRTLTFEIPGKKDVLTTWLGNADFKGIGPVTPFAGGGVVPNSGPGGGTIPGPPAPLVAPTVTEGKLEEALNLILDYMKQNPNAVPGTAMTSGSGPMPVIEQEGENLRLLKEIADNTRKTKQNTEKKASSIVSSA